MPQTSTIIFIGAPGSGAKTGGELYNQTLSNYLSNESSANYDPVVYPWKGKFFNLFFDLRLASKLMLAKNTYVIFDVSLHQRMIFSLIAAMLNSEIKLVSLFHQLSYIRRSNQIHKAITRKIEQLIVKLSYKAISAGVFITPVLESYTKKSNVREVLTTLQAPIPYSSTKKPFQALFVGSIVPSKGIEYLINAVNVLPSQLKENLKIFLAGNKGDEIFYTHCLDLIKKYNLSKNFTFLGMQNLKQLEVYYTDSELFLFPSLTEGMGMALLEAMSAGCFPIVFNNSSMPYIVEDGVSGHIAKNKNSIEFAKAIVKYYDMNENEKSILRKSSSKRAKSFVRSWHDVCHQFVAQLN